VRNTESVESVEHLRAGQITGNSVRAPVASGTGEVSCDVTSIDRILADEYTQVSDNGRVVMKTEFIASFEPGTRHWDEAHVDEIHVTVYREAAALTGRWQARRIKPNEPFDYIARNLSG
jgi:hypothetical protein